MNNQKFASVTKFDNGTYCAFYEGKSIGGICKTKKECIDDLRELGYTYISGNNKVKLSKSLTTERTLVTVSRVSYGYVDNGTFFQTTKATQSVQDCLDHFITSNNLTNA